MVLHAAGRDGGRRAGHGDTGGRVDDGNGIARAGGRRLVELQRRLLAMIGRLGMERGRARIEREAGSNLLRLLRGRRFRRVTGQGGPLRGTADGDELKRTKISS